VAGQYAGNCRQYKPANLPEAGIGRRDPKKAPKPEESTSILSGLRLAAFQNVMAFDSGLQLVQAANTITNRGAGFSKALCQV
jgi:hypothetical protein